MMLQLRNVMSVRYWFDVHALAFSETVFWFFVAWLGTLTAAFIVLRVFVHKEQNNPPLSRFLARLSRGVLGYGIFSAIFLFFRSQEVLVVAMRFWYLFATAIFAVWATILIWKFNKRYEGERKAHEERLRRESYFSKGRK